jgi:hypothetical protein
MQNTTLRHLVTWLLIASPLWWTCGCYSFLEINFPRESTQEARALKVTTKGQLTYVFSDWTIDSLGNIRGKTIQSNPSYMTPHWWDLSNNVTKEPEYLILEQRVWADSIAEVKGEYFDLAETVLAGLGIATGVVIVAYLFFWAVIAASGGFRFNFSFGQEPQS